MIYTLGSQMEETDMETVLTTGIPAIFLITEAQFPQVMEELSISVESDSPLSEICFCKVEAQQECLYGTFAIPRLLDVLGSRYRIACVITEKYIVLADNDGFARRLVERIRRKKAHQGETRERFLYNFMVEFISKDAVLLENYERELMDMEDQAGKGHVEDIRSRIQPIRKQLLTLRGYYDQIADMGRDLEENENRYFAKKQLRYFGTVADRADRLKDRTSHLLEYAQQVRDSYQAVIDAKQNENMQFLTMISTIFFPLTLITGWYGMNFQDMPELDGGYPVIILVSILVVIVCIFIFKKKKIL
ncbi:cobalt transporter [Lachnoclostridium sp. An196]|uniref:magnesium transporter CorA family protein n=1 Tax=Lachnoclostridium sp. An196 TaxID=1965583 RepID=UPI000B388A63|nr:CorA family divalent cation transporter [Lachnoclostridium sp. An196]OUP19066.1 cobalt transporter [Lachnoclostridium sp. An196]